MAVDSLAAVWLAALFLRGPAGETMRVQGAVNKSSAAGSGDLAGWDG